MLAYQWHEGNRRSDTATPVVFLHGLLGSQSDWQGVLAHLQNIPKIRPLTLDLPFHGESAEVACRDFAESRKWLDKTLNALIRQPFYLVGYSLGGRLALDYALNAQNRWLKKAFLEGANIGLKTAGEKLARWQNDQNWANRFRTEKIESVLADWYQQPVFAHLTANKRSDLIEKRRHNRGEKIAEMLEMTSLAKQADYSPFLPNEKVAFIIGEQDQKFRQMAEENRLEYGIIAQAGHNAHDENPQDFAQYLLGKLE